MIWEWKTIVLAMVKSVPLQCGVLITKQTEADFTIRQTEALYLPSVFNSLFSLRNFLKLFKSTSSVEGLTGYFIRPLKIPALELFLPFSYPSTLEIPILLKYL